MKILIIGSKGTLGQALVAEFSRDYEVLAWDREEIDITVQSEMEKVLKEKPGLVINSAAYTDVDGAEENQEMAEAVNTKGPENLSKICAKIEIPFVHYSTEYIFDGDNEDGYGEDAVPNPQSVYGRTKLEGEETIRINTDKYYILRLSRLFGKTGGGKKSFIDLMLELSERRQELEVVDEEVSSPTYVVDLAKTTREIIKGDYKYGIFHCANSGACTWYGFAEKIFKILGKDVKLNPVSSTYFPRPAARPKYAVLLNTKLSKARSWQQALQEYLEDNSTLTS